jgi:hypothetical protein
MIQTDNFFVCFDTSRFKRSAGHSCSCTAGITHHVNFDLIRPAVPISGGTPHNYLSMALPVSCIRLLIVSLRLIANDQMGLGDEASLGV